METDIASSHPFNASPATRAPHPAVSCALRHLSQVLTDLRTSRVTPDLVDDVADVVDELIDTHPLTPPLYYPEVGADDDAHARRLIRAAIADLEAAVDVSNNAQECLRAAIAARQLGNVLTGLRA